MKFRSKKFPLAPSGGSFGTRCENVYPQNEYNWLRYEISPEVNAEYMDYSDPTTEDVNVILKSEFRLFIPVDDIRNNLMSDAFYFWFSIKYLTDTNESDESPCSEPYLEFTKRKEVQDDLEYAMSVSKTKSVALLRRD